jgi:hypothetical protein
MDIACGAGPGAITVACYAPKAQVFINGHPKGRPHEHPAQTPRHSWQPSSVLLHWSLPYELYAIAELTAAKFVTFSTPTETGATR